MSAGTTAAIPSAEAIGRPDWYSCNVRDVIVAGLTDNSACPDRR